MIYRRRRLEPFTQRMQRSVRRLQGGLEKRQRVYLVEIGDARMKQIVLGDPTRAAQIADNLERLEPTKIFPRLITRVRGEIWVEYIDGHLFDRGGIPSADKVADLFAAIYGLENYSVPTSEESAIQQSARDLEFLESENIVSAETASALAERMRMTAPTTVWIGFDYGDARPQNLIETEDGRLRIIDVESIRSRALVGTGVVRALERWPTFDRGAFLARLEQRGAPPFWTYMRFLEIAFLCARTKRRLLQRKLGMVDRAALERAAGTRTS